MSEYQEKFELVAPWMEWIVEGVRKDLKNEHLKKDRTFCKKYFLGKNPHAVSIEEMAPAYLKEIAEGNVGLGEFIASRWLFKHSDIYDYFEEELSKVNPDFEAIVSMSDEEATPIVKGAVSRFGSLRTYLFAVLNSVAFSATLFATLRAQALKEQKEGSEKKKSIEIEGSLDALQKRHAREIASLQNKYEKKLSGMEKRYFKETEVLKNQISTLTKKLAQHG